MAGRIGIVGLGLVGTAIAERLLGAGFEVFGFDIDSARCAEFAGLGGQVLGGAAEVGGRAERVVLSLPDTDVVLQVVEGKGGILESAEPAGCIIDTTTGDPDATAALAQRLGERRIALLDAPFSGSSEQLRSGDVVFMAGGDELAFERCGDIFEALGQKIFYLGASGSGSRAKLASNLVLGLNRLAFAEGLVFAKKLGLDAGGFLELLKVTPAYSAAMDVKGGKMLSGDFAPQARLGQHYKDVSIILKYAELLGQGLPLSKVHAEVLAKAIAAGDGDLDNSAVIREIERRGRDYP